MPQLKVDLVVDDKGSLVVTGFGQQVDKTMWSTRAAVKGLGSELRILSAGVAAVGGSFAAITAGVVSISDEYTLLHSRLGLVTDGSAQLAAVEQELYKTALETHQAYSTTADLYTRLARSTEALG